MASRKSFKIKQLVDEDNSNTLSRSNTTEATVDEEGFTVQPQQPQEQLQELHEDIDDDNKSSMDALEKQIKVVIVEKKQPDLDDFSSIQISEIPTNTVRRRNPSIQQRTPIQQLQSAVVQTGSILINEKINALFTQDGFEKSFVTGEITSNGPLSEQFQFNLHGIGPLGIIHFNPLYLSEIEKNFKYLIKSNVNDRAPLLKYQVEPLAKDTSYTPYLIESIWKFETSIKCILTITKNAKARKTVKSSKASVLINANQTISQHKTSVTSYLIGDSILKMDINLEDEAEELRILIQMHCAQVKELGIALQFQLDGLISDVQLDALKSETICGSGKYIQLINKHLL